MKARNNPSNGSFSFKDPLKKLSSGVSDSHMLNVKNFSELISLANVIRNRLLSLLPQLIPNQVLVGGVCAGRQKDRLTLHRCGPSQDTHTHTHILTHILEVSCNLESPIKVKCPCAESGRTPEQILTGREAASSNPKLFYPAVAPPFHWSSVDGT